VKIYTTITQLQADLQKVREQGKIIGFVPTMGALHQGHLSLIQHAKQHCDYTVCSIFVNPTQFNDPKDLEKYPRPLEQDQAQLEAVACDVLFLPEVGEMYTTGETWSYDLGQLDTVWEGANRPGHFTGVTQIVFKLFKAVQPNAAFFGQKDFQQCMVVAHLIKHKNLPIRLHIEPTVREESGLAMSSRNQRLSESARNEAAILYQLLQNSAGLLGHTDVHTIEQMVAETLDKSNLKLEYFGICRTEDLQSIHVYDTGQDTVLLIAAWIEGVRLIDNLMVNAIK
jgi:pantoate--beta-alanine ligase